MRSFWIGLLLLVPAAGLARPVGISGFSGKGGAANCTMCHTTGATVPTVTLTGPATLNPGQTATYNVKVTGGPGANAGFDVALSGVNSGLVTLTPGAGSKALGGELTHSAAKVFTLGAADFPFTVTAPSTAGPFTLSAAGLSTNGSLTPLGDACATTSLAVTVLPGAGTDAGTTPPPVDAGTTPPPAADGGTAPPATSADGGTVPVIGQMMLPAAPLAGAQGPDDQGGLVQGEGCSAAGGAPRLLGFALVVVFALARARRARREA